MTSREGFSFRFSTRAGIELGSTGDGARKSREKHGHCIGLHAFTCSREESSRRISRQILGPVLRQPPTLWHIYSYH